MKLLHETRIELHNLLSLAWQHAKNHAAAWRVSGGIVLLTACLLFPIDDVVLRHLTAFPTSGHWMAVARWWSYWGDFQTGSCILAAVLWTAGKLKHNPYWRTLALTCLLASALAGLSADCFRYTLGRPRPYTGLPDRLYGPHWNTDYHSFPSGHAATSWGTASTLVIAMPSIGIPACAAAGAVTWSRLYLQRHHLSDVLVGSFIGIFFGINIGAATRSRRTSSAGT